MGCAGLFLGETERSSFCASAKKLRAVIRIGEISRSLEKAQGARTELSNTAVTKLTKEEQLEAAGLNRMTASRYEELAADSPDVVDIFNTATVSYSG